MCFPSCKQKHHCGYSASYNEEQYLQADTVGEGGKLENIQSDKQLNGWAGGVGGQIYQ